MAVASDDGYLYLFEATDIAGKILWSRFHGDAASTGFMQNSIQFAKANISSAVPEECKIAYEIYKKGKKLFKKDKYKGLTAFVKAHDMCPNDKRLTYNLGIAYYRYGSKTKAYDTWKSLYKKGVRSRELLTNLSLVALELGELKEAEKIANEGLRRFPEEGALLDTLVKVYFVKRDCEKAYCVARDSKADGAKRLAKKAAKCLVDSIWRKYHSGLEKEALKEIYRVAKLYPQEKMFKSLW